MKIRKATIGDVQTISKLGKSTEEMAVSDVSKFWGVPRLTTWIKAGQDVLLVAEDKDKIIGFVLSQIHYPTQTAYLSDILVVPEYRGKGLAKKLIEKCRTELREKGVTFLFGLSQVENKPAHKFLKSVGFNKGENMYWFEIRPL